MSKAKWNILGLLLIVSIVCPITAAQTQKVVANSMRNSHKPAPVDPAQTTRDVLSAFDQYVDAWKRGDVNALSKIYANDAELTAIWPDPSWQYPLVGWEQIHKALTDAMGRSGGMDVDYYQRHVELLNNVAVISTDWKWLDLTRPPKPNTMPLSAAARSAMLMGQATFVFEHRGPQWILVHEHSSVPPRLH